MLDRLQRLLRGNARPDAPIAGRVKGRAAIFDRSPDVVKVVGESFRQEALERIAGGRGPTGVRNQDHLAGLRPEPDNPKDPEAVEVEIDALLVGYLSRADARAYRPIIDRLATHGLAMACQASLIGGWDRGEGDRGAIGVQLHVGTPAQLWAEIDTMFGPSDPPAPLRATPSPRGRVRHERVTRVAASSEATTPPQPVRMSVCFTGPSAFAFHGEQITRTMQEMLAEQHGLVALPRVTKKLDVLVIGRDDPRTGKRAKAEAYGTTVVDEAPFWAGLGVTLDPLD